MLLSFLFTRVGHQLKIIYSRRIKRHNSNFKLRNNSVFDKQDSRDEFFDESRQIDLTKLDQIQDEENSSFLAKMKQNWNNGNHNASMIEKQGKRRRKSKLKKSEIVQGNPVHNKSIIPRLNLKDGGCIDPGARMLSPEVNVEALDVRAILENENPTKKKSKKKQKNLLERKESDRLAEEVKYIDITKEGYEKRFNSFAAEYKSSTKCDTIGTSNSAM